jgi:Ca-activated chloride channel family protein
MRRMRIVTFLAVLFSQAFLMTAPAAADGIIIPEPPICDFGPCPEPFPISQLAIEYHRVTVRIEDQVAITHVDQVFRNDNDWTVEGTYIFPIPEGAAVTDFTLWIDGEPVEGEVLTKEQARQTYEEIVRSMRDPALLEYIDRGAVQASIFPIPAGGERRIELEYSEILAADNGLIHYRYPLNTEKFSTMPLEDVSVSIDVESPQAVRAIYSPTHPVDIHRAGEHRFSVGYEDSFVTPDKDFDLYYSVVESGIGLNLLSFRDRFSQDGDGFFLLLAAPSVEVDEGQTIAKDVILVLDRSGSMEGEKFRQAQAALQYILQHLNPDDRFNIIAFSTGLRSFADELKPVQEISEASRWVDTLSAAGSTDINLALLEAAAQAERGRTTILIFLTDGLPTEGVVETEQILANVQRSAPEDLRLFAFGVGYDVDTFLLDSLAQNHHGTSMYVTPDQAIDEAVSGFYAKVSTPVLTNLEIDFGEITAYDLYPDPLPDLFAGSQLVLVGRYKDSGVTRVELSGLVDGRVQVFEYDDQYFRSSGGAEFLPRLWATRKIGSLLNEVRLRGPQEELVDQIVRLSIQYGIVTPYTSFLVTEPKALGQDAQDDIAADFFGQMLAAPSAVSGEEAVERAAAEGAFSEAEVPLELDQNAKDIVQVVGSRTFSLIDGVWVDTRFDPESMPTTRLPFLSEEYFSLASERDDVGAALALGPKVILLVDGIAIEVVDEDEPGDALMLPEAPPDEVEGRIEQAPTPAEAGSDDASPRGFTLPCPGMAIPLGLVAVPLLRRKRRS